ncbi:MAG: 50S ribosomal protein L33 [Chloroflexota bacterium]
MAKKENRIIITLACGECKERNYTSEKNRKNDSGRITLVKYCRRCRKRTEHREQR